MSEPQDLPHPVPTEAYMTWKENWVFPTVDTDQRITTLFHFSLRPQLGEGIFTAKMGGPGWKHRYVGRSPVPRDLSAFVPVQDERLTFTVAREGQRFRIAYMSDDLEADLFYEGRFPTWDFHDGPQMPKDSLLGDMGRWVFHFNHQEQALAMKGEIRMKTGEMAGERLAIAGYGCRDHSWGWRDDFAFRSHHWICASFHDRYVQGTSMTETFYPDEKFGGWVSTGAGNTAIAVVDTSGEYWLTPNEPLGALDRDVTYRLETIDGAVYTLQAHIADDYGRHWLNARSDDRSQVYMDCQIFCDFTLVETGERGYGVLEVGKHIEGPGIADRVGRSADSGKS